eukprot:gnl/Chilomastix_cuspidata/1584.p1 GENE.gnl/Chilomastix_cuspidata/1584~~gnl/Chilomastix_cuspidata/1584.p1  ORF type:complete len:1049 (+),score=340.05 gnl/Chilomastix_cuspidata/1584:602-3748(+)
MGSGFQFGVLFRKNALVLSRQTSMIICQILIPLILLGIIYFFIWVITLLMPNETIDVDSSPFQILGAENEVMGEIAVLDPNPPDRMPVGFLTGAGAGAGFVSFMNQSIQPYLNNELVPTVAWERYTEDPLEMDTILREKMATVEETSIITIVENYTWLDQIPMSVIEFHELAVDTYAANADGGAPEIDETDEVVINATLQIPSAIYMRNYEDANIFAFELIVMLFRAVQNMFLARRDAPSGDIPWFQFNMQQYPYEMNMLDDADDAGFNYLYIVFTFIFVIFVQTVVQEKETKFRLSLRLGGMREMMYYSSWLVFNWVIGFVDLLFIYAVGMMVGNPTFAQNGFFTYFSLIVIWSLEMSAFVFTLSSFFTKARSAVVVCIILLLFQGPFYYFLWIMNLASDWLAVYPFFALFNAVITFTEETGADGTTLRISNYDLVHSDLDHVSRFRWTLLYIFIGAVVWFFVGIWLDLVLPTQDEAMRKTPLFMFGKRRSNPSLPPAAGDQPEGRRGSTASVPGSLDSLDSRHTSSMQMTESVHTAFLKTPSKKILMAPEKPNEIKNVLRFLDPTPVFGEPNDITNERLRILNQIRRISPGYPQHLNTGASFQRGSSTSDHSQGPYLRGEFGDTESEVHFAPMEDRSDDDKADYDTEEIPPLIVANIHVEYNSADRKSKEKKFVAVHKLTFSISEGECFGLLGPNGAGKTTTISCLSGILLPTFGTAFVQGIDIVSAKREYLSSRIGLCPQFDVLMPNVTVFEHIRLFSRLKRVAGGDSKEIEEYSHKLAKEVGLGEVVNRRASELSGGMRRRLSLAVSLTGDPKIVLLDEPSSGLDPATKREIWDIIPQLKKSRALLLTTHAMDEAQTLCDRIGIMVRGSLACIGTEAALSSRFGKIYNIKIVLEKPTGPHFDMDDSSVADAVQQEDADSSKRIDIGEHSDALFQDLESLITPQIREIITFMTDTLCPSIKLTGIYGSVLAFEVPTSDVMLHHVFQTLSDHSKRLGISDWSVYNSSLQDVFCEVVKNAEENYQQMLQMNATGSEEESGFSPMGFE